MLCKTRFFFNTKTVKITKIFAGDYDLKKWRIELKTLGKECDIDDNDLMICKSPNGDFTCYSIREMTARIENGNMTDPYTNKKLSTQLIAKIELRK